MFESYRYILSPVVMTTCQSLGTSKIVIHLWFERRVVVKDVYVVCFVSGFLYLYLISTIIHAMNLHGRKPHQT